jgi:hypothetical protein
LIQASRFGMVRMPGLIPEAQALAGHSGRREWETEAAFPWPPFLFGRPRYPADS